MSDKLANIQILLARDLQNLTILRDDAKIIDNIKRTYAPDCSDIIQYILIPDTGAIQKDAYREGIRRYILAADELLLTPSWMFEIISFIFKNMRTAFHFSERGGFDRFLAAYPNIKSFIELWRSEKWSEAESIYRQANTWPQILALTRNDQLIRSFGAPIQRLNVLLKTKLKRIPDLVDVEKFIPPFDETNKSYIDSYNNLVQIRPETQEESTQIRNELDAQSFSTISYANQASSERKFSIVTASRMPLNAFYQTLKEQPDMVTYWSARSPITVWAGDLTSKLTAENGINLMNFLNRGIELITEIKRNLPIIEPILDKKISFGRMLAEQTMVDFRLKGETEGLLEMYTDYYRGPIFRTIEKFGKAINPKSTLDPADAIKILKESDFEKQMAEAKNKLRETQQNEIIQLLGAAKTFVKPILGLRVGKRRALEILDEFERDFEKDVL